MSNQTFNEIEDATYFYTNGSMPEIVSIINQKNGNYSVRVAGIENGVYNLTCTSIDQSGAISTESFTNMPIQQGESQNYIIPEFPSFFILPLFMVATILAAIVYRRKKPILTRHGKLV